MARSRIKMALASMALGVAGLAFTGGQTLAATETVQFSGTIGATCTLSNPVAGTLGIVAADDTRMHTNDAVAPDGVAGSIRAVCSGPAEIKVDSYTVGAPAGFVPLAISTEGYVSRAGRTATSSFDGDGPELPPIVTSGPIDEDLVIDLEIGNSGGVPLPDGEYTGSVTVSVNPL